MTSMSSVSWIPRRVIQALNELATTRKQKKKPAAAAAITELMIVLRRLMKFSISSPSLLMLIWFDTERRLRIGEALSQTGSKVGFQNESLLAPVEIGRWLTRFVTSCSAASS